VKKAPLPRPFAVAGTRRGLLCLGALALICGAAMLPAMRTMADHGASLIAFESAGSVSRSREIIAGWGAAGKAAMWWQLTLDTPFLIGYGLFLAGACAAIARRAHGLGMPRLERAAAVLAWLGPIAAASDLVQNVALGFVLGGHLTQPWPRISALTGLLTTALALTAAVFALAGALATRRPATGAPARSGQPD
jgi:hypothetical protein